MKELELYTNDAIELLQKLIAIPSVSRTEKDAADALEESIIQYGFKPHREGNNIWILS